MNYHFKIHKEQSGYWAQCIELPGCVTQGDTREELIKNMHEALNLYIEEPDDSTDYAVLPDTTIRTSRSVIAVEVDPHIALAYFIRRSRIERGLTQRETAELMGFDSLFSYQRLERKPNPNLKTLRQIKRVFPELSVDEVLGQGK